MYIHVHVCIMGSPKANRNLHVHMYMGDLTDQSDCRILLQYNSINIGYTVKLRGLREL